MELLLLTLLGTLIGILLTALILKVSHIGLPKFLPSGIDLTLSPNALFLMISTAVISTLCFCLPAILKVSSTDTRTLLSQSRKMSQPQHSMAVFSLVPGLVFYWITAVLISQITEDCVNFHGVLCPACSCFGYG